SARPRAGRARAACRSSPHRASRGPRPRPRRPVISSAPSASGAGYDGPRAAGLGLLVLPELVAKHAADLADRAALAARRAHRDQQVALPAGYLTQLVEPLRNAVVVAVLLERLQPLDLLALR